MSQHKEPQQETEGGLCTCPASHKFLELLVLLLKHKQVTLGALEALNLPPVSSTLHGYTGANIGKDSILCC